MRENGAASKGEVRGRRSPKNAFKQSVRKKDTAASERAADAFALVADFRRTISRSIVR